MKRKISVVAAALVGASLITVNPAEAAKPNCTPILHRGWVPKDNVYGHTENQPEGIRLADRWGGFAEIDATVMSDGGVYALHDAHLGRLTDLDPDPDATGPGRINAWTETVDTPTLLAAPHPYGAFRETVTLINEAARLNSPIMVNINAWGRVAPENKQSTLDLLYEAAQNHPRPHVVYFGGADDAMHAAHPDAATFVRYGGNETVAAIVEDVTVNDVDLVGLWPNRWRRWAVNRVREAGARVATRHVNGQREARQAQAAGINLIQSNWPRKSTTRWCR